MENKLIVDNSWRVIERMIKDWQKNPYIFLTERDVQAELYRRLYLSMNLIGEETVEGLENKPGGKRILWNRLTCEPTVKYIDETGNEAKCIPDLVIWDKLDKLKKEDDKLKWKDHWPILLSVELKYYPDQDGYKLESFSKMQTWWKRKIDKETKDLTKLRDLLRKHKSMYGCTVYLATVTSKDGECSECVKNSEESNLRQYYACLPSG